jgi:hypothetical protein
MAFTDHSGYRIFVGIVATDPARFNPLRRKLHGFAALPVGWSHGEGVPVSDQAVRVAEYFVDIAAQLQLKADVFPGLYGDCAVAFYQGDRSVEVIVHAQNLERFGLHVEAGSGFHYETIEERDDAPRAEVVRHIIQLVPWKSPVSSRYVSSTGSNADFRMSSSSTLQESPLTHLTGS